ncbi:hypothetical protein I899_gp182 [Pelagibacter phage HTVC008M]|jgi:hypothetical protein|uniref:hypothetical protein n=1 Tax=Pelagibacter phage HTVC008M TaxID=1283076 RepID=UPI0002B27E37|nr:hypothetical protein I899_gp182 [Pelagibacter phage HTVC008M]AGE60516.1 hypothetical protein [Pelagibacter phage HTVC008M]
MAEPMYQLSFHEILTKVNNAKDKNKKIEVLNKYDTKELRMLMKLAFDKKLVWKLPEDNPPYKANEAPLGTEGHIWLKAEVRKLFHFLEGGNPQLKQLKREAMFIETLEALSEEEAKLLLQIKDRELNKIYKGLTENLVKEAFNWDDNFMRINK